MLTPIAGALASALLATGLNKASAQAFAWLATLTFAGVAGLVWRRKSRDDLSVQLRAKTDIVAEGGPAFRGLASFQKSEYLPGAQRRRDAAALFALVTSSAFRFGILAGPAGSGKSSLLRAGLISQLEKNGIPFEIIESPNDMWLDAADPHLSAHRATTILTTWLRKQARSDQPQPVFLIIDQFEQILTRFRAPADRISFGTAFGRLLSNKTGTRLLLGIRQDYFVELYSLGNDISRFLLPENVYTLRNFSIGEAIEVIKECCECDRIKYQDSIPSTIANDLSKDDVVQPAELQLVCTALSGDFDAQRYRGIGGAVSILAKYISHAVELTESPALARRILRSLCDFSQGVSAPPLTGQEIADALGLRSTEPEPILLIERVLNSLHSARVVIKRLVNAEVSWGLIHDYLVGPIRLATEDLSTRIEEANRLLATAIGNFRANGQTIRFRELRYIERYAQTGDLYSRDAISLLRRSRIRIYGATAGLVCSVALASLGLIGYWSAIQEWKVYATVTLPPIEPTIVARVSTRSLRSSQQIVNNRLFVIDNDKESAAVFSLDTGKLLRSYTGLRITVSEEFDMGKDIRDGTIHVIDPLTLNLKSCNIAAGTSAEILTEPQLARGWSQYNPGWDGKVQFVSRGGSCSVYSGQIRVPMRFIALERSDKLLIHENDQLNIIRLSTGALLSRIPLQLDGVFAASDDGSELAIATDTDNTTKITVMDITSETPRLMRQKEYPRAIFENVNAIDYEKAQPVKQKGRSIFSLKIKEKVIFLDNGTLGAHAYNWRAVIRKSDLELIDSPVRGDFSDMMHYTLDGYSYESGGLYIIHKNELHVWRGDKDVPDIFKNVSVGPNDSLFSDRTGKLVGIFRRELDAVDILDDRSLASKASVIVSIAATPRFSLDGKALIVRVNSGSVNIFGLNGEDMGAVGNMESNADVDNGSGAGVIIVHDGCEIVVFAVNRRTYYLHRRINLFNIVSFTPMRCMFLPAR